MPHMPSNQSARRSRANQFYQMQKGGNGKMKKERKQMLSKERTRVFAACYRITGVHRSTAEQMSAHMQDRVTRLGVLTRMIVDAEGGETIRAEHIEKASRFL